MKIPGTYRHILILLLLLAVVFGLFGGTLDHGFNSDDYVVIYHALNPATETQHRGLSEFLRPSWGLYYRPGIVLLFSALARAFKLSAAGYHLVSLLCYAILCFEVYLLGLLTLERTEAAVAATVIFMTSAAHGEPLFWISSLNGVVANVLALASLACFISWRRGGRRATYFTSFIIFAAALFTKESAIAVPLVIAFYDMFVGGPIRWPDAPIRATKSCWPFFVLGALFIVLRAGIMMQVNLPPPLTSFGLQTAVIGLWRTLLVALAPIDWAIPAYYLNRLATVNTVLLCLLALCLLALAGIPLLLKRWSALFFMCWILIGATPLLALGVVPSERHVLFSSAGGALLISAIAFGLSARLTREAKRPSTTLALVLVAAFAFSSCYFLKQSQGRWKHASDTATTILEQTVGMYPAPAPNSTFFFLNVPDVIDGAFVFRFEGLTYALRLTYGDTSLEAVRIVTLDRMPKAALSEGRIAYFTIGAMGGHMYLPPNPPEDPEYMTALQSLDRLRVLKRDAGYADAWERYSTFPFLVYDHEGTRLRAATPAELKTVLQNLYSLT